MRILFSFIVCFSIHFCFGQDTSRTNIQPFFAPRLEQSNQSISILPATIFDDVPEFGKSLEFMYERRIWDKFFIKAGIQLANVQVNASGIRGYFELNPDLGVDTYGDFFRGLDRSQIKRSYVQNLQLIELSINYRFGKKNQFIPELGIKYGSGSEAKLKINGVSAINGIVQDANTMFTFMKNPLFGLIVGLNYSIKLKNNFYLIPSLRLYNLSDPKYLKHSTFPVPFVFSGRTFGIVIRKDLIKKKY